MGFMMNVADKQARIFAEKEGIPLEGQYDIRMGPAGDGERHATEIRRERPGQENVGGRHYQRA
eukprot:1012784-Prymnesium_polylepis.1